MDFLREIVSGPKNRFRENGYNLDLTYICPRLIAMSFPASGVESVYRNPIDNVTKFIKEKHANNYLVFNLSGRMYNYSKFQDQVLDFQWEDHHSPPIHTLFQICQKIQIFLLAKKENVCIIHCLAGKGRTGTIVCCFLIYSGLISGTENALHYYSKKRFIQEGFGVNQPCQIRYLQYFDEILRNRDSQWIYPRLVFIKSVKFKGRPNFNTLKGCRPYFDLIYVKTKQLIFSTKKAYSEQEKFIEGQEFDCVFDSQVPLAGDLLVRIKHNGYYKNQKMARISFNTAFIPDSLSDQQVNITRESKNNLFFRNPNGYFYCSLTLFCSSMLSFKLEELSPSGLMKDTRFPKDFVIEIHFGVLCGCSRLIPFKDKCSICGPQVAKERESWEIMQRIVKNYVQLEKSEQKSLLFGSQGDDIDSVLRNNLTGNINYVLFAKLLNKNHQGWRNRFKFDTIQDKFVEEDEESSVCEENNGDCEEEDGDDDDDEGEESREERKRCRVSGDNLNPNNNINTVKFTKFNNNSISNYNYNLKTNRSNRQDLQERYSNNNNNGNSSKYHPNNRNISFEQNNFSQSPSVFPVDINPRVTSSFGSKSDSDGEDRRGQLKLVETKNSSAGDQKRNVGNSPMKIRKRSDVRYNIFSEDQALQQNNSRNNNKKQIDTIEAIKHKLDPDDSFKNLNQANQNNNNSNQIHRNKLSDIFEKDQISCNGINKEDLEEGPPSPLSPKQCYIDKKDNNTDIDSPFEETEHNHPKHSRNLSNFQKSRGKHLDRIDKDSFDELRNDSDDPAPQKPFTGDNIFVNTMKHP